MTNSVSSRQNATATRAHAAPSHAVSEEFILKDCDRSIRSNSDDAARAAPAD